MDIFTHGVYWHTIGMLIGQHKYLLETVMNYFTKADRNKTTYDKVIRKTTNMRISKDPERKGWVKLRIEDGYTIYTEASGFIDNIKAVMEED